MSLVTRTLGTDDHALLALVLDGTHDCVKLLDPDGRIVFVNRRGAEAMDLRAPEELIGQVWIDRWPAAARPKVKEALDRACSGETARFHAMRPRPVDGLASWWDVSVAGVRSADGKLTHFLTIARDVTQEIVERERAQAISAEMRHRLRNALTIAGALVAMGARGKPELEKFAGEVTQRFSQLSSVQAIILDPGASKDFAKVVSMLAAAYGDGALLEFGTIPDIDLDDAAIQALALSFGELCTNSLKYGALAKGAKVRVDVEVEHDFCTLVWSEETEFETPREGGQGLALIDRIVRSTGGYVEWETGGSTLTARISLRVSSSARRAQPSAGEAAACG
jgi:PAS domain S-box-containing protein